MGVVGFETMHTGTPVTGHAANWWKSAGRRGSELAGPQWGPWRVGGQFRESELSRIAEEVARLPTTNAVPN